MIICCKLATNCVVNKRKVCCEYLWICQAKKGNPELCSAHFALWHLCLLFGQSADESACLSVWQTVGAQSSFQGASMPMMIMMLLLMMMMPHSITRTYLAWPDDVQKLLAIYCGKREKRKESKSERGKIEPTNVTPKWRPFRLGSAQNSQQSCKCHKMRQLSHCNNKRRRDAATPKK